MRFKENKPFLAYILAIKFPMIIEDEQMMVWGKTIYTKHKLPEHLLEHEKVHIKQQRNKFIGLIWWIRYTFSVKFRLSQEIEAFKKQYEILSTKESLYNIAKILSSGMYGNIISFKEALNKIKHYGKEK